MPKHGSIWAWRNRPRANYAQAEKSFRRALHIVPNFLLASRRSAPRSTIWEEPKEAETLLRQTLALDPREPRESPRWNTISASRSSCRTATRRRCNCSTPPRRAAPRHAVVDYNRGKHACSIWAVWKRRVFCYRRAIARNPLDMLAHRDMNHLLYRLGRDEEFLRSYDDVMRALSAISARCRSPRRIFCL